MASTKTKQTNWKSIYDPTALMSADDYAAKFLVEECKRRGVGPEEIDDDDDWVELQPETKAASPKWDVSVRITAPGKRDFLGFSYNAGDGLLYLIAFASDY